MHNIHPSIMNRLRREGLNHPDRNVIPAPRKEEAAELRDEKEEVYRPLGRLATAAERIRRATTRALSDTGETTT